MAFNNINSNSAGSYVDIYFFGSDTYANNLIGVRLNINGTLQNFFITSAWDLQSSVPGMFDVWDANGDSYPVATVRENFYNVFMSYVVPTMPESNKVSLTRIQLSGGRLGVRIAYTGQIYTAIDSVYLVGVNYDHYVYIPSAPVNNWSLLVNGFRASVIDYGQRCVPRLTFFGGFPQFRLTADPTSPKIDRDLTGNTATDYQPSIDRYAGADLSLRQIQRWDAANKGVLAKFPNNDSTYLPNIPRPIINSVSLTKQTDVLYLCTAEMGWDTAPIINDAANVYYCDLQYKIDSGAYQSGSTFVLSFGTYTLTVKDEVGYETSYTFEVSQEAADKPEPYIMFPIANPLRFIEQKANKYKRDDNTLFNDYYIQNVQHRYFRQPIQLNTVVSTQFRSTYDNHVVNVRNCEGDIVDTLTPVKKVDNLNKTDYRDCLLTGVDGESFIMFKFGNIYDTSTGNVTETYEQATGKLPSFVRENMKVLLTSQPQKAEVNIKMRDTLQEGDILRLIIEGTTYRFVCASQTDPEYAGFDGYFPLNSNVNAVVVVLLVFLSSHENDYTASFAGNLITVQSKTVSASFAVRMGGSSSVFVERNYLESETNTINTSKDVDRIEYNETYKCWGVFVAYDWHGNDIECKCLSTYNEEDYNIFEFQYISGLEGHYTFEVEATDPHPAYNDVLFKSEPIIVKQFDECVTISYSSADNQSNIDYRTGIEFSIFAPGRFDKYTPKNEDENMQNDRGDVKILKSIYQRNITLEVVPVPAWLIEKLIIATSQQNVQINGLRAVCNESASVESLIENNNPFYSMTAVFNITNNMAIGQSMGIVGESVGVLGASDEFVIGV